MAFSCSTCKRKTKFDWYETYGLESKEPYGISVFEELLDGYFPEREFKNVDDNLTKVFTGAERNSNYVLVGQAFLFKEAEINAMLEFVENGNIALFSTKSIPYDFMSAMLTEPCFYLALSDWERSYYRDTMAYLNLAHPDLYNDEQDYPIAFYWKDKPHPFYDWYHINSDLFCDSIVSPIDLGNVNEESNFMKIEYGEGQIYLHTTPLVFTNYHIRDSLNLEYVEKICSHLQTGDIYWDQVHHISEHVSRRRNSRIQNGPSSKRPQQAEETPLKYILSQPPLAWAWYTLVGMAILYLIFRAKRRQRMIPVTQPVANTSLEFITTIGKLYFQRGNPRQVIFSKMKYLQGYIKKRYGLPAQDWDAAFIKRLSLKSQVPSDLLEKIKTMHKNVSSSRFASDTTLIDFHRLVEEFFRLRK